MPNTMSRINETEDALRAADFCELVKWEAKARIGRYGVKYCDARSETFLARRLDGGFKCGNELGIFQRVVKLHLSDHVAQDSIDTGGCVGDENHRRHVYSENSLIAARDSSKSSGNRYLMNGHGVASHSSRKCQHQPLSVKIEDNLEATRHDSVHHEDTEKGRVEELSKSEQQQKNVGNLQRRLKSRHIQFLALSGAIGTGLFVGTGQVLSLAGPLSAVLAYLITGFNLYAVINSMGEMATWLPLPGAVPVYASRFVDEALGFTLGWNYWYQFAIGVPIEISAAALVIDYWPNAVSSAVWITVLYVVIFFVNILPVRVYGELEFFLGSIKLMTIVGLMLLMLIITLGESPRRNVPKAVRRVFWRIAIFYVGSVFLIGLCVSPFVIAIENGGIHVLPSIINAVVLTSAVSADNSFFYASTRILYSTALDGKAPRFLRYEKFGVPYACVAITGALSLLVYLNVSASSAEVFFWISNLSSVSTLIVWTSIAVTYIRFYRGLRHYGISRDTLPFKAPFQPYMAYFAVIFPSTVAFFNGFDAFFPGHFSAKTFVPPYIDIPIFVSLFLGYKVVKKTKLVELDDLDLWSGKDEADRLESIWEEPKPRNFIERIWFWIA
ncbi:hypothetical protein N7474_002282 [Penicillium riverlandense]|uniref:uncharacterized protein n=1 Tax=Penicillium riverlandense TaxID=1903569 RepID=UPI0025497026|nr:uncharacterized protein N7474_002282 [Penicillium riverlandense]KAJ5833971.1 hypothetical protein N7474_002282 [Penicillium riverlandense]